MAELIDWLNEKGEKIGEVERAVAHKNGYWHKSVHVWIINDRDEVLLQHRCRAKKFFPNRWDCAFAGHVDAGESSLISALREGKEELGIELDKNEFELLFTYKDILTHKNMFSKEFVDVYLVKKNVNISELSFQKEEVDTVKWIKKDVLFKEIASQQKNGRGEYLLHGEEEYDRLYQILNTEYEKD